jgi:hypothetical protein
MEEVENLLTSHSSHFHRYQAEDSILYSALIYQDWKSLRIWAISKQFPLPRKLFISLQHSLFKTATYYIHFIRKKYIISIFQMSFTELEQSVPKSTLRSVYCHTAYRLGNRYLPPLEKFV